MTNVYREDWDKDLPRRVSQAYYELDDDDLHHYAAGLLSGVNDGTGLKNPHKLGRQLVAVTHALAFSLATIGMLQAKLREVGYAQGGGGRRVTGIREATDPRRLRR